MNAFSSTLPSELALMPLNYLRLDTNSVGVETVFVHACLTCARAIHKTIIDLWNNAVTVCVDVWINLPAIISYQHRWYGANVSLHAGDE